MARWRRRERGDAPTAREWARRGAECLESDLDEEARACLTRALAMDPAFKEAWFDLGLVHKMRKEWAKSLECNRRAAVLYPAAEHEGNPAFWNAGIAATALEDWGSARWAWLGYGVTIADGTGPIEEDFGLGVVRLPTYETVWGRRIDPARIVLGNVPLPDSGFRCGDIVLHDGAPEGSRVSSGREYPVFPVLARWRASLVPTVEAVVEAPPDGVARLIEILENVGITAENWTSSIALHCDACSFGRVDFDRAHYDHDHRPAATDDGQVRIGCSGELGPVRQQLTAWAQASSTTIVSIAEVG